MRRLSRILIGCAVLGVCLFEKQVSGFDKETQAVGGAGITAKQSATNSKTVQPMARAAHEMSAADAPETIALTADQQSQMGAIFQQLDIDIQNLLAGAESQIEALLTPQQQTQFAAQQLDGGQPDQPIATAGSGVASGSRPLPPQGDASMAGTPGDAEKSGGEHGLHGGIEQLSDLTDAQRTGIDNIMSSLRMATEALHSQARTDLRAILTPAQIALFDQQDGRASVPDVQPGTSNASTAGSDKTANDPLQLSEDQKTQADAIFAQLHADLYLLHEAARQRVLSLLTDAQKTQLEAAASTPDAPSDAVPSGQTQSVAGGMAADSSGRSATAAPPPPPGPGEQGRGDGEQNSMLDRLTSGLNLTTAQSGSIKSILDNLQTAIQSRVQQSVADLRAVAPGNSVGTAALPAVSTAGTSRFQ